MSFLRMQSLTRNPNFLKYFHLYVRRKYTDLTDTIADVDRDAFAPVALIGTQGDFTLAPGLTRAIELAEKDLALHLDKNSKAPPPKRPRHTPPTPP